ncbi:Transthyretin-like protein 15 [Toxocara canis]|uniref:Transthyretin-like protein 15 n=2 Tax=Toxocara canis TaxID=6265 RepID=A0A0B2V733_TOXCA|nr:Transthyretin-like protein 15 [Toxocara canis]VDM48688.1 unnamed protein product [Toxocara canis]
MVMHVAIAACTAILIALLGVEAGHKCVWVHGAVRCNKDPSRNLNVEIRAYDKDGLSIAKLIDPDDLMGVTFTNEDGSFQLDGCGDDFDWIPGIANDPEPFIQILHYCNSDQGDVIMLPRFRVFVPQTYELGIIDLDKPIQVAPAKNVTE